MGRPTAGLSTARRRQRRWSGRRARAPRRPALGKRDQPGPGGRGPRPRGCAPQAAARSGAADSLSPETFQLAQEACAGIENVQLFNKAVSEVEGKLKFYLSSNPAGSSLQPFAESCGGIEVEAVRLDKWAAEHAVTSLDLVKIDVQGHDLAVIKGMGNLARTVKILIVEVWFQRSTYHCALYEDVAVYLRQYGLRLYGFSCLTYYENKGLVWGGAILANGSVHSSALQGLTRYPC